MYPKISISKYLAPKIRRFFEIKKLSDYRRFFILSWFLALEGYKFLFIFNCGCQFSELNNWLTQSIFNPYSWRTLPGGQRFVAGPYSFLWYILYSPAALGFIPFMLYLFILDLVISSWLFTRKSVSYLMFFSFASMYFVNIDPVDAWIFWFAIFGEFGLFFSLLAIATKLPILAPDYVWDFVFNNPYGIHEPDGYFRYSLLIFSFLLGITLYFRRWKERKLRLEGKK